MDLKSSFQKLAKENNIFHSYIFFGNNIDFQFNFALDLANFLENKNWQSLSKPLIDCLVIESSEEGSVGIDAVKGMSKFLWQRPIVSSRKTLIVKNANHLTTIAQNALLKITEEAPSSSLIILITRDKDAFISTLLSRFQKIYIASPTIVSDAKNDLAVGVVNFLKSSDREKVSILKKVIEDDVLDDFIKTIIFELDKDPIKNFLSLKELLYRWTNINKYNTNKKLQLEAWIKSSQF